jgi:hypothetical protein
MTNEQLAQIEALERKKFSNDPWYQGYNAAIADVLSLLSAEPERPETPKGAPNVPADRPDCSCGSEDVCSARYGHSHLKWCSKVADRPDEFADRGGVSVERVDGLQAERAFYAAADRPDTPPLEERLRGSGETLRNALNYCQWCMLVGPHEPGCPTLLMAEAADLIAALRAELEKERGKHDEEAYNDMKAAKEAAEAIVARWRPIVMGAGRGE